VLDYVAVCVTCEQDLYKKVRGILNKLTPQKFKTLIQQVLDLQIDTEHRLKGCIDIIFEKVTKQTHTYNHTYTLYRVPMGP